MEKQDITFDGIYTGYLASKQQCVQIAGFIERFSEKDTLTVVDPAMADNGKLYPAFDSDFPMAMAEVCRRADVILPNITEASFLTGMPYRTTYEKLISGRCWSACLSSAAARQSLRSQF